MSGSIEKPTEILEKEALPTGSRLRVAMFPFTDELVLPNPDAYGELELQSDGSFRVTRQPVPLTSDANARLKRIAETRLLFPIETPSVAGVYRVRCNIYFRNVLVQARVITAVVGESGALQGPALRSELEYSLTRLFSPRDLAPIQQHAVSIMLNSNGEGTHEFRFFGNEGASPPFISNAHIDEGALSDVIDATRRTLRMVSWGNEDLYKEGDVYRYGPGGRADFSDDLISLFRRGFRIYGALINELAGGASAADTLSELMRTPGRVQIVSHGSPSELIPASIIYDYTNARADSDHLTICPQFVTDRQTPDLDLRDAVCFKGACPSLDTCDVVCPSGFWGFRHALGMPVITGLQTPIPPESHFGDEPKLGLAVYSGFSLLQEHEQDIRNQVPGWQIEIADTYDKTIALLKEHANVVYFYCHGGISPDNVPYLRVGTDSDPKLEQTELLYRGWKQRYDPPRTLIIVNGCRTTSLEPDRAIELVTAFVQNVGAMGVIGTEVTIFEEMARDFGLELLRNLRDGVEVGESVKLTRLFLLKQGNPLGLVYVPFVAADARLVHP